jgi:hypothetical protein
LRTADGGEGNVSATGHARWFFLPADEAARLDICFGSEVLALNGALGRLLWFAVGVSASEAGAKRGFFLSF